MLLSVIIPVYNNAPLLERCLLSLCAPPMAEHAEVVVVDDGSSAPVGETLEAVVRRVLEPRHIAFQMLRQAHQGAATARNKGIEAAQGQYCWFVDADDTADTSQLAPLLAVLLSLPAHADLLHTGAMQLQHSLCTSSSPDVAATQLVPVSTLLQPCSAALDHTTYLVSRSLMQRQPSLRYPAGHSLLEDSCFVLALLEGASCIYSNDSLHPYVRHTDHPSTTAGAWSLQRCETFVPDISFFFNTLVGFLQRHPDIDCDGAFFRRYRYLYLRVLAVKGCPWALLTPFRSQVLPLPPAPKALKERLLFSPFVHRLLAAICCLWRKKR